MKETAIEKREQTSNVPAERIDQGTWYTPLVDIIENNDAFLFQADMPGVKPGDVDVSYENGRLTISGKVSPRYANDRQWIWNEYGVGHYYRSFDINTPVNVDGIRAELKSGVLSLYVPKHESAKTRKIQIQS